MAYTTIKKPSDYFNTKLYTGNGGTQTISGVGFEPDFTWIKVRSTADSHSLQDQVRGANTILKSDSANAEFVSGSVQISSWNSDGFALGSGDGQTNGSGQTYVSWNWLASNTTGSNTDGSITTTVSVNQTSGFSIISYAGNSTNSTIGHGLNAEPEYLIFKERDGLESWRVWSKYTPNTSSNALALNTTDAAFSQTGWISGVSTSTISIGTDSSINTSGNNYICYAFAPKMGFSKFGSYTGNGSTDGTFVYTGFKPAFVMIKNTSVTQSWHLIDNRRLGYNPSNYIIQPNVSQAESALNWIDLVSNGFKHRNNDAADNASGNNYIYMAFAEEPLVGDNPATAR